MTLSISNSGNRLLFWSLIGPLSVLLAVVLGVFRELPEFTFLTIASLLGVMVTTYSFYEIKQILGSSKSQSLEKAESLQLLKTRLREAHREWELERGGLFSELIEKQSEIDRLLTKLRSAKREITIYQDKIREVKAAVVTKQVEVVREIEIIKEVNVPVVYEHLYKQLKAQFEEKTATLAKVRAELFVKEHALLTQQLKEKMRLMDEDPYVKKLQIELQDLYSENHQLEQENKSLEDLVSSLYCK